MTRVLIGIQARSGSTRLPRKAWKLIAGRSMLDRCIEAASQAAKHIGKRGVEVDVAVLTPEGDPIADEYAGRVRIVEGPEFDVLGRYGIAMAKYQPDFLVRVTGDCPLLPGYVIDGVVKLAIRDNCDYLGNSDERFRTSIDGVDTEVVSERLFEWLHIAATEPYDREHVTPLIRRTPPPWAKIGTVLNWFDLSSIKLSVDTQEELERARKAFEDANDKYRDAVRTLGQGNVYRL